MEATVHITCHIVSVPLVSAKYRARYDAVLNFGSGEILVIPRNPTLRRLGVGRCRPFLLLSCAGGASLDAFAVFSISWCFGLPQNFNVCQRSSFLSMMTRKLGAVKP